MSEEKGPLEESRIIVEKALKEYLDKNNVNTLFAIRQKIKKSEIDKESLRILLIELKNYGDYRKHKVLYDLCMSVNFNSSQI